VNQKKVVVSDNSQTVDTTPPTNTSISIDSGAASTTSTSVTLTLAATDATEMYVTNTSGCGSGGAWEGLSTSKAWTLGQTNGVATVYVKFRDALLNESSCINDTITQVDEAPIAGTGIVFSSLATTSITVSWGAGTDALTSTNDLQYKLVKASNSAAIDTVGEADSIVGLDLVMDWTSNTVQASATGLSDSTTYYFAVLVRDAADNKVLYSPQNSTTLDGTAPAIGTAINFSSVGATSLTVSWGAATDNVTAQASLQYKLVKASTSTAIDSIAEVDALSRADVLVDWGTNTLTQNVSGLTVDTPYYFSVVVRDAADNKAIYSVNSATTSDSIAPTIGTGISFSAVTSSSMTVSWGAGTDNVTLQPNLQYKLVRATTSDAIGTIAEVEAISGADLLVDWGTNTLSYNASSLSEATTYHFSVVVRDASNNKAIYSVVSQSTTIQTDVWTTISNSSAPAARDGFTSIWTGSRMIVWGGYQTGVPGSQMNTGGIYNPSDNSWTPTNLVGAPSARSGHIAIWTGSEMIIWGGQRLNIGIGVEYLGDGASYNPQTNTWTTLSSINAPESRSGASSVWTGTELIIWGGGNSVSGVLRNGGRYNPTTNSWSTINTTNSPQATSGDHVAVWTGSKMLTWGNYASTGSGYLCMGGVYDPDTDSWSTMSGTNAPSGRSLFTGIWTGTEMIIWGGWSGTTYLSTGRAYDPQTDSWTAITSSGAPSARGGHAAVWTGTKMIVWGGSDTGSDLNSGAVYDRLSDAWTSAITLTNAPSARRFYYYNPAIYTGDKLLIWGGGPSTDTGGAYVPP
jgi:N-acetylneuraminic acid mutarotase